ncbi:NINE protein [Tamlana sp. I1]|uniref:NINE protein n=1 Tax=Tamlana sp. I1 TaxID=2762061 RepID=UPI00188E23D3|nr:NINE protein [Tamlana sp. I1]
MTEDKNTNNDLNKAFDSAKEKAKGFAEEAKETASEFAENAKETFGSSDNQKVLAGILALLFGAFGVHKFILGYNKEGGILLGITVLGMVLSCVGVGALFVWMPGAVGFIEGIIYLTKSDADFYNTYQVGKKPWF